MVGILDLTIRARSGRNHIPNSVDRLYVIHMVFPEGPQGIVIRGERSGRYVNL